MKYWKFPWESRRLLLSSSISTQKPWVFWNRCKGFVWRERGKKKGKLSTFHTSVPQVFSWEADICSMAATHFWAMLTVRERWQLNHVIPFTLDKEASYRTISVKIALRWQKSSGANFPLPLCELLKMLYSCTRHPSSVGTWPGFPFQHKFGHLCNMALAVLALLLHAGDLLTWIKALTSSYCCTRFRALSLHVVGLSRSHRSVKDLF